MSDRAISSAARALRGADPTAVAQLLSALGDDRGALIRLAHAAAMKAWATPVDAEDVPCGRCGHLRSAHRLLRGPRGATYGYEACQGHPVLEGLPMLRWDHRATCACGLYQGPGAAAPYRDRVGAVQNDPCASCGTYGCDGGCGP